MDSGQDRGDLVVVSADAHVNEPHNLWYDRLPEDRREFAPRYLLPDGDNGYALVLNGDPIGWMGQDIFEAMRLDAERDEAAQYRSRLEMMAVEGVSGEMVYPTIGLFLWSMPDSDLSGLCCRIYNDWIIERFAHAPRSRVAGVVPTGSVEAAIAEAQRNAELGFAGQMLPIVGTPGWNHKQWEPLWSALEEIGLPVVMHLGTGHPMVHHKGPGGPITSALTNQGFAAQTVSLLAMSGVLERHPNLHFALIETDAGWLPWTINTLDRWYVAHPDWTRTKLDGMPSDSIRRQIHVTFQDDPVGVANLEFTGADCLMWGNDYPHPEGSYPHSKQVLAEMRARVSAADARKIFGGTAARIFGFDLAALAEPLPTVAPVG
jgi:predicted TIM-barrel fold metal-dependent hydrolase